MENGKQTAVEWLVERVNRYDFKSGKPGLMMLFKQAKQIEKEQIIEARETAPERIDQYLNEAEDYYNETFGKDEQTPV